MLANKKQNCTIVALLCSNIYIYLLPRLTKILGDFWFFVYKHVWMKSVLLEFLEELAFLYHEVNEHNYEKKKERENKRMPYILERTDYNYEYCFKAWFRMCFTLLLLHCIMMQATILIMQHPEEKQGRGSRTMPHTERRKWWEPYLLLVAIQNWLQIHLFHNPIVASLKQKKNILAFLGNFFSLVVRLAGSIEMPKHGHLMTHRMLPVHLLHHPWSWTSGKFDVSASFLWLPQLHQAFQEALQPMSRYPSLT